MGHGAGKPTAKQVDERTDILEFRAHNLEMEIGAGKQPKPRRMLERSS